GYFARRSSLPRRRRAHIRRFQCAVCEQSLWRGFPPPLQPLREYIRHLALPQPRRSFRPRFVAHRGPIFSRLRDQRRRLRWGWLRGYSPESELFRRGLRTLALRRRARPSSAREWPRSIPGRSRLRKRYRLLWRTTRLGGRRL